MTTDALGHTVSNSYDSSRRLTTTTDALNLTQTLSYDGNGNVATTVDPLARVTTTTFDKLGQLTQVQDALGGSQYGNLRCGRLGLDRNGYSQPPNQHRL